MLSRMVPFFLVIALAFTMAFAQSATPSSSQETSSEARKGAAPAESPTTSAPSTVKPAMQGFGLEDGTPVKLRTARTISSSDAHTGDTLDFEVLEDVMAGDHIVIRKGGIAWGTVTEAQPKRRMGRGGKLDVNIDSVRLSDGEKVPLRAVKDVKGGSHTGAMTGAMVATGIVFFPAAPLFLFMHGKDITIPKGTDITAYINGDTRLDEAKFQAPNSTPDGTPAVTVAAEAELEITSTPPGADIEVDGKFVGNTPSSISVVSGDHDITIKKTGFIAWERKTTVSAGRINIAAELTAESK